MPESLAFWTHAAVLVGFHLLATFRRRWYWPFCDWPMFASAPSLVRSESYRVRLRLGDAEAWWRPHYDYRARDFSVMVAVALGRVEAGIVGPEQAAGNLARAARALVGTDSPGLDLGRVTRIEIVRLVATPDDAGGFAIAEEVVFGFDPPRRGASREADA
jgi:hypothetical protein